MIKELPISMKVSQPSMVGAIERSAAYIIVTVDIDGSIRAFTNLRRSGDIDRTMIEAEPMLYEIVKANRGR